MRRILSIVVTLVWGLWFGGLIVLFLSVTTLFRTFEVAPAVNVSTRSAPKVSGRAVVPEADLPFDPARGREVAGIGAARIFHLFNEYQLALATIALLATFAWRVLGPPRLKEAMFALFALATVAGCSVSLYLAPRIEALQRRQLTHSPQFARLHGYSMIAYTAEVVLLLVIGIMIPWINVLRDSPPSASRPAVDAGSD